MYFGSLFQKHFLIFLMFEVLNQNKKSVTIYFFMNSVKHKGQRTKFLSIRSEAPAVRMNNFLFVTKTSSIQISFILFKTKQGQMKRPSYDFLSKKELSLSRDIATLKDLKEIYCLYFSPISFSICRKN